MGSPTHAPADGFRPWGARAYGAEIAHTYERLSGDRSVLRVELEARHCNAHGIAHGGFLAALTDAWAGYLMTERFNDARRFVTSSLTVDFLRKARMGDVLYSAIDQIHAGRRVGFLVGALKSGDGDIIATFRSQFLVLDAEPFP
jgi:uncharacterized protein (TIGR00369 family)